MIGATTGRRLLAVFTLALLVTVGTTDHARAERVAAGGDSAQRQCRSFQDQYLALTKELETASPARSKEIKATLRTLESDWVAIGCEAAWNKIGQVSLAPTYEDASPANGGLVRDDPAPPAPGREEANPTDGGLLGSEQTMTPIWFSDVAQPTTPLLFLAGSAAPIAAPATDAVADPVREPILEPVAASPATDAVNDAIGACFDSGGDPEVTIEDDYGFRSVDCVYEDHQEYCYYYDDGNTSCEVIYSLTPPAGGLPLDVVGEIGDRGAVAPGDPTLPGVGGAAPGETVAAAPTAPSLDKAAFKAGCEQGGGSYVENSDGSFQCNLRNGGTIKCPNTTSPCTSIPAPDKQPDDNRNPIGDIGDGGVVALSDPTPPVADPVTGPIADPILEPVVAPIVEPVVAPIVEPVVEPILAPVAEPALADPQGFVTIEDEQP